MTEATPANKRMVDTNILIYAADPASKDRHRLAGELVKRLVDAGSFVLSVQVLNEFYYVSTRPHKPPHLSHSEARTVIEHLALSATVFPLTRDATFLALDAVGEHGLSFWDALIWAVAKENSVPVIYTEDFQHGREIEGVHFQNPFVSNPA